MLNVCPECHETVTIFVNDGGSHYCSNCKITFHYCNKGIKYGSPGPSLCNDCKLKHSNCNIHTITDIHTITTNIINYNIKQ